MSHIQGLSNANLKQPSIVTIGVFDGVHRGHQHLIRSLIEEAHSSDRLAVVLTFFPHPDVVLRGLHGRYYLTTPRQRADFLLGLGVDHVITHPFNEQTRQVRAAAFVDQLQEQLRMSRLWVGPDFAMGYKREGDVPFLQEQAAVKGFSVHVIGIVQAGSGDSKLSSTLIREALEAGNVQQVREWLGRGYALEGRVLHGKKRGRTLGFPTANLEVWDQQVIPANGIYAGWAYLGQERFMAMTNVGISPTFGNEEITVEAYLLDFDRDIYDQYLTITFEKYIRPEGKYNSLQELIDRINLDIEEGRVFLSQLAEEQQI
jgi:riboflavin kinase / FMN adenylyltransferase